ncbi:MAG: hypothetical protein R2695_08655 [Acidimicrobiales bacterium]
MTDMSDRLAGQVVIVSGIAREGRVLRRSACSPHRGERARRRRR